MASYSNSETMFTYEQAYPHIGWNKKSETYRASMTITATLKGCTNSTELCSRTVVVTPVVPSISATTSILDKEVLPAAGEYGTNYRVFPFVKTITEQRWEMDGTALPTKTTQLTYEEPTLIPGTKQWGNLTKREVIISDGHKTKTENTFEAPVELSWTLGRMSKSIVTSTRPARTISVGAPSDAAPPPSSAGPLPISPSALAAILSLLLD